jgi:murein DD-endopeptidase MepM/ murein hydrolase activator NlpD
MRESKSFPSRLLAAALLVVLLGALSTLPASAATPEEQRLTETREQLSRVRAEIEASRGRVGLSQEALNQAEAQLRTVLDAVGAAEAAVARQQESFDAARRRLAEAEGEVLRQQQVAAQRAIELYQQGNDIPLQTLLSARDTADALERTAYVGVVSQADRRTIEGLEAGQRRVQAETRAVREEEEALNGVLEQQRQILTEAEALRNERDLVLAADTAQLEDLQAQELHLENDGRELQRLALANGTAAAGAPAPSREGWVFPASGPITSEFGSRWGRLHAGIDVGAPTGSPIVAATDGCLSFRGQQGGYGNMILIEHGGGVVTAYAHQSRFADGVAVGDCVLAGDTIGFVGSTGNSTGPHLHFEVRVNGTAQDPLGWVG